MKLETAKDYILLSQSGELSPGQQEKLDAFLADSEEARRYQREVLAFGSAASRTPADGPEAYVLHRIQHEARHAKRHRAERVIAFTWRPALATAAALLLVAAGWMLWPATTPTTLPLTGGGAALLAWDDQTLDQGIEELDQMLVAASDEFGDSDLDEMAAELLEWKGSEI